MERRRWARGQGRTAPHGGVPLVGVRRSETVRGHLLGSHGALYGPNEPGPSKPSTNEENRIARTQERRDSLAGRAFPACPGSCTIAPPATQLVGHKKTIRSADDQLLTIARQVPRSLAPTRLAEGHWCVGYRRRHPGDSRDEITPASSCSTGTAAARASSPVRQPAAAGRLPARRGRRRCGSRAVRG
jgi:hypothetical protein